MANDNIGQALEKGGLMCRVSLSTLSPFFDAHVHLVHIIVSPLAVVVSYRNHRFLGPTIGVCLAALIAEIAEVGSRVI